MYIITLEMVYPICYNVVTMKEVSLYWMLQYYKKVIVCRYDIKQMC